MQVRYTLPCRVPARRFMEFLNQYPQKQMTLKTALWLVVSWTDF